MLESPKRPVMRAACPRDISCLRKLSQHREQGKFVRRHITEHVHVLQVMIASKKLLHRRPKPIRVWQVLEQEVGIDGFTRLYLHGQRIPSTVPNSKAVSHRLIEASYPLARHLLAEVRSVQWLSCDVGRHHTPGPCGIRNPEGGFALRLRRDVHLPFRGCPEGCPLMGSGYFIRARSFLRNRALNAHALGAM